MAEHFLVIQQQIIGSPASWGYSRWTDYELFDDRQAAIDHGWKLFDHDDFNIGTVRDGRLVAFGWGMDKDFPPEDSDDPAVIDAALNLSEILARRVDGGSRGY